MLRFQRKYRHRETYFYLIERLWGHIRWYGAPPFRSANIENRLSCVRGFGRRIVSLDEAVIALSESMRRYTVRYSLPFIQHMVQRETEGDTCARRTKALRCRSISADRVKACDVEHTQYHSRVTQKNAHHACYGI